MTSPWGPDTLGRDFDARRLDLGVDDEGELYATLVRYAAVPSPHADAPAVLYVHGYNDYFFQRHLAQVFAAHGVAFYAIDLRKCGRSWHEGQTPFYVEHLADYGAELGAAARIIRDEDGHRRLIAMGHSTGGLIVALWANALRGRGVVDAVVLNSPWLDLNSSWLMRTLATDALTLLGPVSPMTVLDSGPSPYSRHLHVSNGGEWEYDSGLKSWIGTPVRAGWLRAVRLGQAQAARGLHIDAPVWVASAETSGPNEEDNPELEYIDAVLDVEQIQRRAAGLGADVTIAIIPGGMHDLALSHEPARGVFFSELFAWLADRGLVDRKLADLDPASSTTP